MADAIFWTRILARTCHYMQVCYPVSELSHFIFILLTATWLFCELIDSQIADLIANKRQKVSI